MGASRGSTPNEEGEIEDLVSDGSLDKLTGEAGADWFIISLGDTITDLHASTTKGGQGDVVTVVD